MKGGVYRMLTNIPMNNSKKITWKQILHAIIQAAIAALTALGVTSCTTSFKKSLTHRMTLFNS